MAANQAESHMDASFGEEMESDIGVQLTETETPRDLPDIRRCQKLWALVNQEVYVTITVQAVRTCAKLKCCRACLHFMQALDEAFSLGLESNEYLEILHESPKFGHDQDAQFYFSSRDHSRCSNGRHSLISKRCAVRPSRTRVAVFLSQKECNVLSANQRATGKSLSSWGMRTLAGLRNRRLPFSYTGSPLALGYLAKLLYECDSKHSHIQPWKEAALPKRVLDVGSDPIRMIESGSGQGGRYIALSHCWGTSQPLCRTTKRNLRRQLLEVPWSTLSKTFQQAVEITRQLDIQYLWIDSMCIVQDDEDDWAQEASKMHEVYSHAYATLAATSSSSDDSGFFAYTAKHLLGVPFATMQDDQDGKAHEVRLGFPVDHHSATSDVEPPAVDLYGSKPPLLTRAWVLQEMMLSTRILRFDSDEVAFQCPEGYNCECTWAHSTEHDKFLMHALQPLPDPKFVWQGIVKQYTRMSLTMRKDRLFAISGLASKFRSKYGEDGVGRYIAGMWEKSLIFDMLWWSEPARKSEQGVTTCDNKSVEQPLQWMAPTWSWASSEDWILFDSALSWKNFEYLAAVLAL